MSRQTATTYAICCEWEGGAGWVLRRLGGLGMCRVGEDALNRARVGVEEGLVEEEQRRKG